MHKKEAKYVVNLTNKNIALDGRFVEKFGILYLGTKEPKQWNTVYSTLIRKGKIMLARTHQEAIEILEKYLRGNLVSAALKRNAKKKDVDNEAREIEYDGNIRRYTTEKGVMPATDRVIKEEPAVGENNDNNVEDTTIESPSVQSTEVINEETAIPESEELIEDRIETAEPNTQASDINTAEQVEGQNVEVEEHQPSESEAFELAGSSEVTEEISIAELKAKAKAAGVKGYTKMSREDLIEALKG